MSRLTAIEEAANKAQREDRTYVPCLPTTIQAWVKVTRELGQVIARVIDELDTDGGLHDGTEGDLHVALKLLADFEDGRMG